MTRCSFGVGPIKESTVFGGTWSFWGDGFDCWCGMAGEGSFEISDVAGDSVSCQRVLGEGELFEDSIIEGMGTFDTLLKRKEVPIVTRKTDSAIINIGT